MTWDTKGAFKKVEEEVARAAERSGRSRENIRIIGVSKKKPIHQLKEALEAGCLEFGENYLQEALPKIEALQDQDIRWHFIGALQSRKVKGLEGRFSCLHSVDRWSLVKELKKLDEAGKNLPHLLVQVNLQDESTKGGVTPQKLEEFLGRISEETNLNIQGLMFFPPYRQSEKEMRKDYSDAYRVFEKVQEWKLERIEMKQLSMGISHDFELAIEEGANMVRVGTRIFGPRNP